MHPSFYLSIALMVVTNFNIYAVVLFGIKSIDIVMKLVLIKQVFITKEVSHELSLALLAPIHKLLPYVGVILYPSFVFLAFSS